MGLGFRVLLVLAIFSCWVFPGQSLFDFCEEIDAYAHSLQPCIDIEHLSPTQLAFLGDVCLNTSIIRQMRDEEAKVGPHFLQGSIPEGVQCKAVQRCNRDKYCWTVCEHGSVEVDPWLAFALKFQRGLANRQPLCQAQFLGTHNSGITAADGYGIEDASFQKFLKFIKWVGLSNTIRTNNQWLSLTDQLNLGVRALELDTHWVEGQLRLALCGGYHSDLLDDLLAVLNFLAEIFGSSIHWDTETVGCNPSFSSMRVKDQRVLSDALQEIASWMQRPENSQEFLIIYFDDQQNLQTWDKVPRLMSALTSAFHADTIVTPLDFQKKLKGKWPRINDLVSTGKRLLLVSRQDYGKAMNSLVFSTHNLGCEWQEPLASTFRGPPACSFATETKAEKQPRFIKPTTPVAAQKTEQIRTRVESPGAVDLEADDTPATQQLQRLRKGLMYEVSGEGPTPKQHLLMPGAEVAMDNNVVVKGGGGRMSTDGGRFNHVGSCELQFGPLNCNFEQAPQRLVLDASNLHSFTECGINILAPDSFTPATAAAQIWSWAPGHPFWKPAATCEEAAGSQGDVCIKTTSRLHYQGSSWHNFSGPAWRVVGEDGTNTTNSSSSSNVTPVPGGIDDGTCVVVSSEDGLWRRVSCAQPFPTACKRDDNVSSTGPGQSQGPTWTLGYDGLRNCPDGYVFDIPHTPQDNMLLQQLLHTSGLGAVFIQPGPDFLPPSGTHAHAKVPRHKKPSGGVHATLIVLGVMAGVFACCSIISRLGSCCEEQSQTLPSNDALGYSHLPTSDESTRSEAPTSGASRPPPPHTPRHAVPLMPEILSTPRSVSTQAAPSSRSAQVQRPTVPNAALPAEQEVARNAVPRVAQRGRRVVARIAVPNAAQQEGARRADMPSVAQRREREGDRVTGANVARRRERESDMGRSRSASGSNTPYDAVPSDFSCAICLEEDCSGLQEDPLMRLPCQHIFHAQCVRDILSHSHTVCPLCRAPLDPSNPGTVLRDR